MTTFRDYLRTRKWSRQSPKSPYEDFTRDALADPQLPDITSLDQLIGYLGRKATPEAKAAARQVWASYLNAQKRWSRPPKSRT